MSVVRFHEHFGVHVPILDEFSPVMRRSILGGGYERGEVELLSDLIRGDEVIMDVGAGIGFLSTYCAKRVPQGNVHAVEANPALVLPLLSTYGRNQVIVNFENHVLADKEGTVDFFVHQDFWASSLIEKPDTKAVKVQTRRLADEMKRISPELLIVDIEGGEKAFFDLDEFRSVKILIVELHAGAIGKEGIAHVKRRLYDLGLKERSDPPNSVRVFTRA